MERKDRKVVRRVSKGSKGSEGTTTVVVVVHSPDPRVPDVEVSVEPHPGEHGREGDDHGMA